MSHIQPIGTNLSQLKLTKKRGKKHAVMLSRLSHLPNTRVNQGFMRQQVGIDVSNENNVGGGLTQGLYQDIQFSL